jgi:ketosteroid isomerase-like protein
MQAQDIIEIQQLMALYGHAVDADDQTLLRQVFTDDAVFDVSVLSAPIVEGLESIVAFFAAGKQYRPPSHNMTNAYVYESGGETRVLSKWFTLSPPDGGTLLGDYEDVVIRTSNGWRIKHRLVKLRYPGK